MDTDCEMEMESSSNCKTSMRKKRDQKKCQVCGRAKTVYNYYGAVCCGGCKQFFRRRVVGNKIQIRPEHNPSCDVTKVKCRHCRLSKCIQIGMNRQLVNVNTEDKFGRFIECLKRFEQPFKRFWDSNRPLPENYTNRHQTLAGLLQDNYNLLANTDQFPDEPVGYCDKAKFINEVETNGIFSMHAITIHFVKDWFILVELAKALPFFKSLCLNDQICQLDHAILPSIFLIHSFYSHSLNAKCVTRKDGLEVIALLEAKQLRHDQRIRTLLLQHACNLVKRISEIGLNYEEFLLLLALLLSNSNADGLSPIGRKKLYKVSIHYSKTLQTMLTNKLGPIGGAKKFASLMDVMNYAISIKYNFSAMLAYMEVFYTKCAINDAFPAIMQSKDAKSSFM